MMYEVKLPEREALWLAGGNGPLATWRGGRGLPGVITATPAGVTLDGRALLSLGHIGCISGTQDGRVVYEGDLPVLVVGGGRYEVREVAPAVPGAAGATSRGGNAADGDGRDQ